MTKHFNGELGPRALQAKEKTNELTEDRSTGFSDFIPAGIDMVSTTNLS